ncbi:hypothetical protein QJ856_gp0598 [Tupanvirus deep ocean]|uniref:Uncharacterized protein n=2 Tax=Tupanvirus TaxID=2094720 RepID=A0AC62A954_9VIRU|nr:hypothetical protein QJ856_gp0598 [Tupanvirus deep ocean]QKU34148.1 hypothetical protein [Tupanvirus deep ocean]
MAGRFTRKMYDGCAVQQDLKQSTDPLELVLDVNKYVHCNNICKPSAQYPPNAALLVDVESSLWGIDKLSSRCDSAKHPFCGPNGCLLTKDPRVAPHITPYACERGHNGENAVVTTNMQMPKHPGFRVPNPNICESQGNGYYVDQNRVQQRRAPQMQPPQVLAPQSRAPQVLAPQSRAPQSRAPLMQPPQVNQRSPQAPMLAPLRNQQVQLPIQPARNQQVLITKQPVAKAPQYVATWSNQ